MVGFFKMELVEVAVGEGDDDGDGSDGTAAEAALGG